MCSILKRAIAMYAIVEIAGQQFKVEKGQFIYTHRLVGKEGDSIQFGNVLMSDDSGKMSIGAPFIKGLSVTGTILEHVKADKVLIFKKKRRKGYRKTIGHRQSLTKVQIEKIG